MKNIAIAAILALTSTAAIAGPFGLPDHEQNGYRDTGCEESMQTPVKNAAGEILYWNNPTCAAHRSVFDSLSAQLVEDAERIAVNESADGKNIGSK